MVHAEAHGMVPAYEFHIDARALVEAVEGVHEASSELPFGPINPIDTSRLVLARDCLAPLSLRPTSHR